mgnify:CR=1 FL=1
MIHCPQCGELISHAPSLAKFHADRCRGCAGSSPKVSPAEPAGKPPSASSPFAFLEQLRPMAPLMLEQARRGLAGLSDAELEVHIAKLAGAYPVETQRLARALARACPERPALITPAPGSPA